MLLIALLLVRCANESTPQGGKKDDKPPKAKKISPENKTLHFHSDKITITFDEYIKPTGFAQTIISPPLEKRPDFKVSGKTLTIKLKSPLRDSTTYTINFAEDIKDVNEGNIASNFTYVFSTGDFIDSQKVNGKVLLAKDNSAADGVIIGLYPEDSANAIKTSKPYYFAKTDKNGAFKLNNIKAGKYWVYALKDQNYNYIYDQPNEQIAFLDSIISLRDSLNPTIELRIFEEVTGKISYQGYKAIAPGNLQFHFNKSLKTFKASSNLDSDQNFWYFSDKKDTINYWYSKYYIKNTMMFLVANDSINDSTTIELKYIVKDSLEGKRKYALEAVNQTNSNQSGRNIKETVNTQDLYKPLKIQFTRPIIGINEANVPHLSEDSVEKSISTKFYVDKKTKQFVTFDFPIKESTSYTLQVPDSTFQDIFGTWSKKFIYKFKTNSRDNYGNLIVKLKSQDINKSYIVRILNSQSNELVKEITFTGESEKVITIENVPAGNYKVTAIDDTNKNGEWDSGNFKTRTQPEKIINYKDGYTLKGGWDLDMEIKF